MGLDYWMHEYSDGRRTIRSSAKPGMEAPFGRSGRLVQSTVDELCDGRSSPDRYCWVPIIEEDTVRGPGLGAREGQPHGWEVASPAAQPTHSPHQNVLLDLPESAAERKEIPVCTGVLDYFPAALAEVARLSLAGNKQHNPGERLHWTRGKSTDQADTIVRHLMERGTRDADGIRHSAKVAWRALALLQEEIEREAGFVPEGGSDA